MFHFWFNTFFVRDYERMKHNGAVGGNGSVRGNSADDRHVLCLTLNKSELDRANKDKAHKLFSPNFQVSSPVERLNLRKIDI